MAFRLAFLFGIALFFHAAPAARAQEPTAYASVLQSGTFVVGGSHAPAGLFWQHPSDDTVWMHKGPSNTRGFSVDVPVSLRGTVQYVACGNGLFKVEGDGARWRETTDWRIAEVLDVVTPASDAKTIYIATANGVFHSHDGGETWRESVQAPRMPRYTAKIIVDRSNERRLWCASYDGVFVSEDGAETWKKLEGLAVRGIVVIRQHPTDPNMFAAGTEDDGLFISRDGGRTWKRCEKGITHTTFYAVAFDPLHPEIVYAGGYGTGVYKSVDGGASWRRMGEGLKNLNIHSLAVDPRDSRRIYAATLGDGVYRSDDGGALWRSAGLSGAQVWDVKLLDR